MATPEQIALIAVIGVCCAGFHRARRLTANRGRRVNARIYPEFRSSTLSRKLFSEERSPEGGAAASEKIRKSMWCRTPHCFGGGFSAILPVCFSDAKTNPPAVSVTAIRVCVRPTARRGPRQRVVASLGKLDEREAAQLAQGWADLSALLAGEPAPKPAATPDLPEPSAPPPAAPPPQWERWTCAACGSSAREISARFTSVWR